MDWEPASGFKALGKHGNGAILCCRVTKCFPCLENKKPAGTFNNTTYNANISRLEGCLDRTASNLVPEVLMPLGEHHKSLTTTIVSIYHLRTWPPKCGYSFQTTPSTSPPPPSSFARVHLRPSSYVSNQMARIDLDFVGPESYTAWRVFFRRNNTKLQRESCKKLNI